MNQDENREQFPRQAYLELLHKAQHLFDDKARRHELLASVGIVVADAAPQRQSRETHSPAGIFAKPEGPGDPFAYASGPRFAAALVDKLAEPGRLDAALKLVRRISTELTPESGPADLLNTLDRLYILHRKRVVESGVSPDLETYREWVGFDVVHHYSLTDRFFGREEEIDSLDEWLANDGAPISVRCLCALGGNGKSALAWHWLNRALPTLQGRGYRGALWCSFYEKDFDFETLLRRALTFGGQLSRDAASALPRAEVESRLFKVLQQDPFVMVVDGLERLMNGYAIIFDRAIDPDSIQGGKQEHELTPHDRRMTDPRNGAFLRALAREMASRVLITTRLAPAELEDAVTGHEIPHVRFMRLGGLVTSDAEALWKSILPDRDVTDEIRAIFTLSGNHPLVVSILARSVANAGGDWVTWRSLEQNRNFAPPKRGTEAEIRAHIIGTCLRGLEESSYDVLGVLTTSGKPMPVELLWRILQQGSVATGDDRWCSEQQVVTELDQLISLGLVGVAEPGGTKEYDVHPVVRGAVWNLITDPRRERFLNHALSEFFATPDRQEQGVDLNRPTALFQLLVQSGEIDRAWEMYLNKLWWPLTLRNDNRTLLSLLALLLPEGDALKLIPLRSRREQGNATEVLASLLMSAGDGDRSDRLFRWCGAIRLQIGDFLGFVNARHSRCWQTMYEGRLFETEWDLRAMREDAIHFHAIEILPEIECWIGVILALRGCENEARRQFMNAQGKTASHRWWTQALAEGYVYLNEPDQALNWLNQAKDIRLAPAEGKLQEAWERLTRGIALFQKGKMDKALDELSSALEGALRANYAIIQCFAIPYVAEILLQRGELEEAETQIDNYFRIDPNSEYQLSAGDAWRVRALCSLKRGERPTAKEYASKAYRLDACDGPPFVYREGLRRAVDTLRECGGFVPRAESRLPPDWKHLLESFQRNRETGEEDNTVTAENGGVTPTITREEAFKLLDQTALMREASEKDRRWWSEITKEVPSALELPLAQAMEHCGITLESFRMGFEASAHKSVLVVFHQLQAESIVRPATPRPFGELDATSAQLWLESRHEHEKALTQFLSTDLAKRVAYAFEIHDLDTTGIRAFINDNKRRIDYAKASAAKTWWDYLERVRPPMDMLILSESIYLIGHSLEDFVREIATGTDRGIEYAFAEIGVKRAIEDLEVKAISRTEGWSKVQILLRLQDVKQKLAWREATAAGREFWTLTEKKNSHQIGRVLQIAEELAIRKATIDDYYHAYLFSNTDDVQANLFYIDYTRLRNQAWDGAPSSWQRIGRSLASDDGTPAFSDAGNWTEDQVRNRLRILRSRIAHDAAPDSAKEWWASLEAFHPPGVLLRIAEELDSRAANLAELHAARAEGATDNLPAIFAFLDFTRVKKSVNQRAIDLNQIGNGHYENKRYREAILSYEGAIRARPDDAVFYTNLAGAWERVDDIDRVDGLAKAIEALERGLKHCPQSDGVRKGLKVARNKKRLIEKGLSSTAPSMNMLSVVTRLAVEVGRDLIPFVEEKGILMGRMPALREQIRVTTGVTIPGIRFRGNETDMPSSSYLIMIDEIPRVMGEVVVGRSFTTALPATLKGRDAGYRAAVHPVDGSNGVWIPAEDAAGLGGDAWDAPQFIERHLESVIVKSLDVFITHESVAQRLRDEWGAQSREIADDGPLLSRFVRVLRALVDEMVPINAFGPLCTAFLEKAREGANLDEILRALRSLPEIRPFIPGNNREGRFLALSAAIEEQIANGLHEHGDEFLLAIRPEPTQKILSAVRTEVGSAPRTAASALVVKNPLIRRYVRRLTELEFPALPVLSSAELGAGAEGKVMQMIKLS